MLCQFLVYSKMIQFHIHMKLFHYGLLQDIEHSSLCSTLRRCLSLRFSNDKIKFILRLAQCFLNLQNFAKVWYFYLRKGNFLEQYFGQSRKSYMKMPACFSYLLFIIHEEGLFLSITLHYSSVDSFFSHPLYCEFLRTKHMNIYAWHKISA